MQDVYSNLNNNEFKNTVDKKIFDLKNAKNFLVKIIISITKIKPEKSIAERTKLRKQT